MKSFARTAVALSIVISPLFANGQAVISSGGASSFLPKYSDTATITPSAITDANGAVTVYEPFVINSGGIGSPAPSLVVTGTQQYGDGIGITIWNATNNPETGATSNIKFATGDTPSGVGMIQAAGMLGGGGFGYLDFATSSNGILDPKMWLIDNGNLGIGTNNPGGELSIITTAPSAETGIHIDNLDESGYSVLRLGNGPGVDGSFANGLGLHQFGSTWGGDPTSTRAPSSTDMEAFEINGLTLDTAQNAPIRFFTGGISQGNERMRITGTGNVGIGTPSPAYTLDVAGTINAAGAINAAAFTVNGTPIGSVGTSSPSFTGSVGVGTASANSWSGINGAGGSNLQIYGNGTNARLIINSTLNDSAELHLVDGAAPPANQNHRFFADNNGLVLDQPDYYYHTTPSPTLNMFWANNGSVGIGTTTPVASLEVVGNVKISGPGANLVFADGSIQTQAYTGTCSAGGDYAESVDVKGEKSGYEPGDVMVLASDDSADVTKAGEPYSTMVAGIYSTKPGYIGRRQTSDPKTASIEIPMAMVGIVPTKVSAENGSIHRGDMLVTSSLSGYAMKGTDRSRMLGAVVGKAMGSLDVGTGVIEVLVSLQ